MVYPYPYSLKTVDFLNFYLTENYIICKSFRNLRKITTDYLQEF